MQKAGKFIPWCIGLILWPMLLQAETLTPLPLMPEQFRPVQLQYQARKLFITANTHVRLAKPETVDIQPQLASVDDDPGRQPQASHVVWSQIDTSVLGRRTRIKTWMNPDGGILQLQSLRTGSKLRYRQYRYLQNQVYSIKRFPASDAENDWPGDKWSRISEDFYPLRNGAAALPLTEGEGLFYLLSVIDWRRTKDQHMLYLFDPDGVMELRLIMGGLQDISTDYELIDVDGTKRRIKGTVSTRQVLVEARPWQGKGDPGNFDFLGFKGNLSLFIDPRQQLIVLMRGDVDVVGEVDVRLLKADLR